MMKAINLIVPMCVLFDIRSSGSSEPEAEMCPPEVSVAWVARLPYCDINNDDPATLRGFVINEFVEIMTRCCSNDTVFIYSNETFSNVSLLKHQANFILPVGRSQLQLQAFNRAGKHRFIPMVAESGKIIVTPVIGRQCERQPVSNRLEWLSFIII